MDVSEARKLRILEDALHYLSIQFDAPSTSDLVAICDSWVGVVVGFRISTRASPVIGVQHGVIRLSNSSGQVPISTVFALSS